MLSTPVVPEVIASLSANTTDQQSSSDDLPITQNAFSPETDRFGCQTLERNNAVECDSKILPLKMKGKEDNESQQRLVQNNSPIKTIIAQTLSIVSTVSPEEHARPVVCEADKKHTEFYKIATREDCEESLITSEQPPASPATPQLSRQPGVIAPIKISEEGIRSYPCWTDPETPQIGTTLLRRESLRRRESPSKRASTARTPSPKKKQLKKRDTLQEREILQRFSEKSTSDLPEQAGSPPISRRRSDGVALGTGGSSMECVDHSNQSVPLSKSEIEADMLNPEKICSDVENVANIHRTAEAFESAQKDIRKVPIPETALEAGRETQKSDEITNADYQEERLIAANAGEKTDLPYKKTRSGTRLSDDTSILKDFLSRAQAKKAAKFPLLSPKVPKSLQESPRRSPRKTQRPQRVHTSSPLQTEDPTPRRNIAQAGSPPNEFRLDTFNLEGIDEEQVAEPASCRRSTRTRLPAPSKTIPGTPSFIPVRRADGTDPVVLHKSQAQELAITTRANTRRNKGQSKPPPLALQELTVDQAVIESIAKHRGANSKAVAWADKLASHHESQDSLEEMEDQRPRIRRMRGIGAGNGTPTAKRPTAVVASSNGTPAPKRRGRH